MTDRYGPQTAEIEFLQERVESLTASEVKALARAWQKEWQLSPTRWGLTIAAGVDSIVRSERGHQWWAALGDVRNLSGSEAWDTPLRRYALDAVLNATIALVARDLIGIHDFTQVHYRALTGPWVSVNGPAHPDDVEVKP